MTAAGNPMRYVHPDNARNLRLPREMEYSDHPIHKEIDRLMEEESSVVRLPPFPIPLSEDTLADFPVLGLFSRGRFSGSAAAPQQQRLGGVGRISDDLR